MANERWKVSTTAEVIARADERSKVIAYLRSQHLPGIPVQGSYNDIADDIEHGEHTTMPRADYVARIRADERRRALAEAYWDALARLDAITDGKVLRLAPDEVIGIYRNALKRKIDECDPAAQPSKRERP